MSSTLPRTSGVGSDLDRRPADPFSEEMADGALEMVETAYGTIPCYRDGWAYIHPQDQEDWLATFGFLKEPLAALEAWFRAGRLTSGQSRRYQALLALQSQLNPVLAELDGSGKLFPGYARRSIPDDEFDLLS